MNYLEPSIQFELFGLKKFLIELIYLYESKKLPNKILLSGQKGLGKSTMSYHFINYVLSKDEEFNYDLKRLKINSENHSFKTVQNKSNLNFFLINISPDKKTIDINQIRELILKLNKSSFNDKPRFVLIDNIEYLNKNSVNALLKILEEPSDNVHFILINNNKKILSTLSSRCINFKIFLSNAESLDVANNLLNGKLYDLVNNELIHYYSTPGNIYNMYSFAKENNFDLINLNLKELLNFIIKNRLYKKSILTKLLIFDLIEFYIVKINSSFSTRINNQYNYFVKKLSDIKKYNLDEETFFIEFEDKVLNG